MNLLVQTIRALLKRYPVGRREQTQKNGLEIYVNDNVFLESKSITGAESQKIVRSADSNAMKKFPKNAGNTYLLSTTA